ncbi:MAG: hypothetical protein P4M11_04785 [Candidatus Pacebacteria bacterium]|nr:hypothetical protein [Candidatus Paceibacterota bacterium]
MVESSAKLGDKIAEAFATLTKKLIATRGGKTQKDTAVAGMKLSEKPAAGSGDGQCCGK